MSRATQLAATVAAIAATATRPSEGDALGTIAMGEPASHGPAPATRIATATVGILAHGEADIVDRLVSEMVAMRLPGEVVTTEYAPGYTVVALCSQRPW